MSKKKLVDPNTLPYRPCVGTAVFNRDGLVWIGERSPNAELAPGDPVWQLPQGGIDEGEAPLPAALRELYEETSMKSVSLLAEAEGWFDYDLPPELVGIALKGKFRGQRQKWFAFRFEGDEPEIDVLNPGGGKHEAEFISWRWERLEVLPSLIVPFKRKVYEQVVAAFRHLAA
ncbi:RNA pyrophosphohydrolase [Kaistia dalseonensis]|uniref:RNA pyrophosphohydrolase n=1 Tax=Kaistia dalseonensis TaxID=410840 RepID=A0ABU0H4L9_9HYPH|nr:RNA pyrophosphohydrolase [Kaistia dalseonensis]MCX5494675.1 RNA pyrophosphohydrolase [Kaistia dalseonensis]MDQ0437256.1 putative (di)nucleoside polyphosphate hydrolase [Kaistia dalseonensis]